MAENCNEQPDTSIREEGRGSGEIVATDDEQDYYVIIRGKESGDTGVYGTWAETAPKYRMFHQLYTKSAEE